MNHDLRGLKRWGMALDFVLVFVSYFIAMNLRYEVLDGVMAVAVKSHKYLSVAILYSLFVVVAQYYAGLYSPRRAHRYSAVVKILLLNAVSTLIFMSVLFLMRIVDFSRLMLGMFWALSCALLIARHFLLERLERVWLRNPANRRHVIVVGNGHQARQFIRSVGENPEWGMEVDGYVSAVPREDMGVCLGSYEELEGILSANTRAELVVALEPHETGCMRSILSAAEKEGARLHLIPFYNDAIPANATIANYDKTRLINMRSVPLDHVGNALIKRVMDVCGSALLILLTSPIMLVTALCVRLSSPGPILFRQERVGKDRQPFMMYKFRSMRITGAENTGWSTENDPRRTRVGCFIRKYSIDELPQLFNVLKGDMSLVGPRPEIPFHVSHFKDEINLYLLRQQVKPGMTGWAQVHGLRGDTSIERRVTYDLWYIENWTIFLDVRILFMTVFGGMVNHEEDGSGKPKADRKDGAGLSE